LHDQAARYEDTDWRELAALYGVLERTAGNPMVALNRAVAIAMADGPSAGLALLEPLDRQLSGHHRLHAVRAHLLEMAGDVEAAICDLRGRRAPDGQHPGAGVPDDAGGTAGRAPRRARPGAARADRARGGGRVRKFPSRR
jgi:hypothetical protein